MRGFPCDGPTSETHHRSEHHSIGTGERSGRPVFGRLAESGVVGDGERGEIDPTRPDMRLSGRCLTLADSYELIDNDAAETRRVRLRQRVPETTDVIMRRAAQPSRGSGQQPSSTLEHAAVDRD